MQILNLLESPAIRVNAEIGLTLPEVFVALVRDDMDKFCVLRPYQRHSWHAFLAQLGAMAMVNADTVYPPENPETWRDLLRALTPEFPNDEPWTLITDDVVKPAFMQPPSSSVDKFVETFITQKGEYKSVASSPQEIDIMFASNNHDEKATAGIQSDPNDWIFALVSAQTGMGFSGSGNYGVSRMNGGYGGRAAFSVTPSRRPGIHVLRDILTIIENRDQIIAQHPMRDGGHKLLWTISWDGERHEALALDELDPLYIEVCRRIKILPSENGRCMAVKATSRSKRLDSDKHFGVCGDPWTLVNETKGKKKALSISKAGFQYRKVVDFLANPEWTPPILANFSDYDASQAHSNGVHLLMKGITGGMGKTEGYHERAAEFSMDVAKVLFGPPSSERDEMIAVAKDRVGQIDAARAAFIRALTVFMGVDKLPSTAIWTWPDKVWQFADEDFFEALQVELASPQSERGDIRRKWLENLLEKTRGVLAKAHKSLPCPSTRRNKSIGLSKRVMEGMFHTQESLASLWEKQEDAQVSEQEGETQC